MGNKESGKYAPTYDLGCVVLCASVTVATSPKSGCLHVGPLVAHYNVKLWQLTNLEYRESRKPWQGRYGGPWHRRSLSQVRFERKAFAAKASPQLSSKNPFFFTKKQVHLLSESPKNLPFFTMRLSY